MNSAKNDMTPNYDLDKIKFATDQATFEKAADLYESGKVTEFKEDISAYSAVVLGTKPYRVSVEARRYDYGNCECYLGQNDTLCKHMVAVALYAVRGGKKLSEEDKRVIRGPVSSGQKGMLTREKLSEINDVFKDAMRYIKSYEGPSRTWFAYQDSLMEGCNRLGAIVSDLPVCPESARLVVDILIRLDQRLCRGGVDDSDGVVGGFMEETVEVLKEYAKLDSACTEAFKKLAGRETCFGWEEGLLALL